LVVYQKHKGIVSVQLDTHRSTIGKVLGTGKAQPATLFRCGELNSRRAAGITHPKDDRARILLSLDRLRSVHEDARANSSVVIDDFETSPTKYRKFRLSCGVG
jgi:hypothetical protein